MALSEYQRKNFETLQRAFANDDVALMECRVRETGEIVPVVCAVGRDEEGNYLLTPLAEMPISDPYERYQPPAPDGGFEGEE